MSTRKILIVDDVEYNLLTISEIINNQCENCECITVNNAKDGIEIASKISFDTAIIDIQMPDMNGIEMCKKLKENPVTAIIPVILLTAHAFSSEYMTEGFEAGADEYLTKPINNIELGVRIKAMLRIKQAEDILRRNNEIQEEIIKKRTDELVKINKKLEDEINERKKIELMLKQAYKMEAVGTLARGIAHDFNNILQIIIGNTDMAIDCISENTNPLVHIQEIQLASNRAKELIQQILNFSKNDKIEKESVNISVLLNESVRLIRSSIPSTVKIIELIELENAVIHANPTQINQIILNLCANATQAMKYEGNLNISLTKIWIDNILSKKLGKIGIGEYVKLTVEDTGCGISPLVIDRIFEPYFTTKSDENGSGLGLAVVYGIVKNHNGAISVSSEPESGTIFDIYLPTVNYNQTNNKKIKTYIQKSKNERIMFIDDEKMLVNIAERMLANLGYRVNCFNDPQKAFESFKSNPYEYDLIITDATMPDIPGHKLAEKMIQIRSDIPIILCTGFSPLVDEEDALKIGIKKFLIKPISKDQLSQAIREILDA